MPRKHETWYSDGDDAGSAKPIKPSGDSPAPARETPEPETTFGPYRLIKMIGQGAQGTVHLAEDTRLHRRVALKLLHDGLLTQPQVLERFQREAAAAARLDHPGICAIYDAGQQDGIPYIAMRFVEGEQLSDRIEASQAAGDCCLAFPDAVDTKRAVLRVVRIIERTARALEAAHQAGTIHRDIKPQNIMLNRDGDPVILDFGLAGDLLADVQLTQVGELFGTPLYMSPEQFASKAVRLDRRTDIYSLGVVLYECLTLKTPVDAVTMRDLIQSILTKEPTNPRRHNPAISSDLKVVIETALQKDRDRRYASAADFADDLRAIAEARPIRAKAISTAGRALRWSRREPAKAALIFALAVFLPAITALVGYSSLNAEEIEHGLYIDRQKEISALLLVGDAAEFRGDKQEAREAYEEAAALDPEDVWVAGMLALSMEPRAAIAYLRPHAEADDQEPEWAARMGVMYRRDGNADEETHWLSVPRAKQTAFFHYERGLELWNSKPAQGSDEAIKCAQQFTRAAHEAKPPRFVTLARMAVSSARAGDFLHEFMTWVAIGELWPDQREAVTLSPGGQEVMAMMQMMKTMKMKKMMRMMKKMMKEGE